MTPVRLFLKYICDCNNREVLSLMVSVTPETFATKEYFLTACSDLWENAQREIKKHEGNL